MNYEKLVKDIIPDISICSFGNDKYGVFGDLGKHRHFTYLESTYEKRWKALWELIQEEITRKLES